MDTNTIITMIGSVGFPIIMCLLMYKMQCTTLNELKDSIDNNTRVTEALAASIDRRDRE